MLCNTTHSNKTRGNWGTFDGFSNAKERLPTRRLRNFPIGREEEPGAFKKIPPSWLSQLHLRHASVNSTQRLHVETHRSHRWDANPVSRVGLFVHLNASNSSQQTVRICSFLQDVATVPAGSAHTRTHTHPFYAGAADSPLIRNRKWSNWCVQRSDFTMGNSGYTALQCEHKRVMLSVVWHFPFLRFLTSDIVSSWQKLPRLSNDI